MSEAKFTPGPWSGNEKLIEDSWRGQPFWVGEIIGADGDRIVANLPDYRFDPEEVAEDQANLRLLAAAPDLLDALEALRDRGHTEATWMMAERAIAKATGFTP